MSRIEAFGHGWRALHAADSGLLDDDAGPAWPTCSPWTRGARGDCEALLPEEAYVCRDRWRDHDAMAKDAGEEQR